MVAAVFITIAVVIVVRALTTRQMPPIVAVARFDNETGDPSLTRFADTLTDTVTLRLAEAGAGRFGVLGSATALRRPGAERDLRTIASTLHADFIVIGRIQRDAGRIRAVAELIQMPEQIRHKATRTEDVSEPTLAATDEVARKIATAFARMLTFTDKLQPDSELAP
jgi:TolB-like protein